MVVDEASSSSESEEEERKQPANKKKNYTIDDIMSLEKSLQITKKQKKEAVQAPVVEAKSKNIKKKKHAKKSQKIVKF